MMTRLLLLADPLRAASFELGGCEATVVTDPASLDCRDGEFDAAVIDGLLERERWDRWILQRVHRALRADAPIVVAVTPLLSVASVLDFGFLAYAGREILVRLLQAWNPATQLPGPARRRYHLPRLVRKMESVGYTDIRPGLRAGRLVVVARKASSLAGLGGSPWPDADAHRKRYERDYAAALAGREAWLSRFPEFRGVQAQALDPAQWQRARVLVLAPHPDDELIGCGGTLCRLLDAGAQVTILHATDGCRLESLSDLPEARRKTVRLDEARCVGSALGAALVLWGEEDQRLHCTARTIDKLSRLLDHVRPTHVFTPFLGDTHADHRSLSHILAGALGRSPLEPQVLQYEVWGAVPANLYCDVTAEAERLERLLFLYERAMRVEDFVHFCERRNLARSLELTGRAAYAEAYLSTRSAEYRGLAGRLSPHEASHAIA